MNLNYNPWKIKFSSSSSSSLSLPLGLPSPLLSPALVTWVEQRTVSKPCFLTFLLQRANNPEPAEEHLPTPQCNTRTQSQVPNTSTTYPRSQASTPGTLPSIGGGQGVSGAPDVNRSLPVGPRGGDLHTDGSAERPRGDCNSQVRQQLVTMGFPLEDITRAQARLRSAGRCRFMCENQRLKSMMRDLIVRRRFRGKVGLKREKIRE